MELLRQRILLFCRRVVYNVPNQNNSLTWLSKGIVSNYNELRHFEKILKTETKTFLENCVVDGFKKYKITSFPYFMSDKTQKAYQLYNNLILNRSIIFDEKIGISKNTLITYCKKIGVHIDDKESYDEILNKYLKKIKI